MKHSKMHLFGIWLLIVVLVFGSVPFKSTYADPSTKKDVSNRFVFDSGINVTYEGNKQQQIPIYTDGNLVGSDTLTEGKKITIKYIWGIPEENFNGTAAGLDGTAIKPGDTFLIELPDNNHLKFNQFTEYKPLGEYGSWRIINKNVGGKNVQYIDGFFNEKVGEMSGGEYVGGLQKGFFEIIAGTYGDGTVNLNLNKTEPPINLKIVPYLDVPLWNPGPFYKQASVQRTDGYITWSLITGFDNLKYAYEQGKFLKNGNPTSVLSDKEAMVVIDRFPLDLDIAAIEFKVPIYFPTPTDNSLNAGLDPTDANYIQPGQLSWRSRHLIYQEFKPSDSVVVQGNGDEAGLQTFIAEIREKGRNSADGVPVIGFYRTATEQVVVVGLGDSPNAKLTYEDYYLVGRGKYFPATLKDAIDDYRTSGKIDDLQYEIMKRVYLNNSKILAWSIGIRVNVNPNITKTYINNGEFRYRTGGPGGGKDVPIFNKIEANFLRVNAGVEPFKRLSFPVEKKWIDKNGSPFNPTDRDSIQVDVYKIVGGSEILLPGHSILLTKDNNWKKSITGLPIFDDEGNHIQYTVKEHVSIEGYDAEVTANGGDIGAGFTITNTEKNIPLTKSLKVVKSWDGSSKQKPIVIYLQKKIGAEFVTVDNAELKDGKWEHTFTNLDRAEEYQVIEEKLLGYETVITHPDTSEPDTWKIVNKQIYNPLIDIHVEKVWADGKGLGSATLELYAQVEGEAPVLLKSAILSPEKSWKHTFPSFPTRTNDSKPITYSIKEVPLTGYKAVVSELPDSSNGDKNFKVTNTEETIPTTDIVVEKKWEGGKANSVEVSLMSKIGSSSETAVDKATLQDSNSWKHTFTGLPTMTPEGLKIVYSIQESPVDGYTVSVTEQSPTHFIITNTKITPTPSDPHPTSPSSTESSTEESSEESSEASSETTTTTQSTSQSSENTAEASGEATTESTTESATETVTTTESTTDTTSSAPVAVITTLPTAPVTTRTFEFIDIGEEIPLGVKTTAPLDLELVLIEEAVPLSGLPYTYSIPAEILVGLGLLILTIGLTVGRKL